MVAPGQRHRLNYVLGRQYILPGVIAAQNLRKRERPFYVFRPVTMFLRGSSGDREACTSWRTRAQRGVCGWTVAASPSHIANPPSLHSTADRRLSSVTPIVARRETVGRRSSWRAEGRVESPQDSEPCPNVTYGEIPSSTCQFTRSYCEDTPILESVGKGAVIHSTV
ncbi:uncharacterized protein EI97DRAFT_175382 [Westerdykella ornata]|uniref:Uncharacterized protein n=1 Tax=Westerdykella ornata TaxID=318751 RepID=A0A6A6JTG5_WESOR|nr:uncharacterized protein EI97DRAFT_175382 [Westerdykella ornata]KAF2279403.1 hypothetical protein EI97DRAFT_175382 [Westerdykella ornata]